MLCSGRAHSRAKDVTYFFKEDLMIKKILAGAVAASFAMAPMVATA